MADRIAATGGALLTLFVAFLVGRDGSPGWQVARVLVVLAVAVVVAVLARRLPPRARGLLAVVAGIIGVTVGVGIGLIHVATSGPTLVSVAGLGCLVSGLVLLAAGARMFLRGMRWWVCVPAIGALVVATALTLLTLGQALAAVNVPATPLGEATPADYGLQYRDVTAVTVDGVMLSGWYVPSSHGGAVILRHGAGSTRADTLAHAEALANEGYGVLMLDARGHGRSGGRAMDFGWYGDLDLRAGVDLLVAQPDVSAERIAVVGLSMGGEEAIGAAATDPRLRAVVAEGAEQRVPEDKRWQVDVHGLAGTVQGLLDHVTYAAADLLTDAVPPTPLGVAAARAAPRPMLLIAAGADADEGHAARAIRARSPETVTVWVVPGAGHIAGLSTDPEEWQQRVAGFLDEALGIDLQGGAAV